MADGKSMDDPKFDVGRFLDQPSAGATTYVTFGLSKTWLHQPSGHVRQELLLCRDGDTEYECARLLPSIVEDVLASTDALLRGAILGPHGPLLPGATTEAFWAWQPVYFPESFVQYDGDEGHPPISIAWLIPLTASEAEYARENGTDAFEALILREDPDLLDWSRPSLV